MDHALLLLKSRNIRYWSGRVHNCLLAKRLVNLQGLEILFDQPQNNTQSACFTMCPGRWVRLD